MVTKKSEIQYPLAYRQPFSVVKIEAAEKGYAYFCLGCNELMVARKGLVNKHHYAHKSSLPICNSSNALHEAAKAAIVQGFLEATDSGTEYCVSFPCDDCRGPIPVNVARDERSIAEEVQAVPGTRSDLVVFRKEGQPHCILEVVVTHDIEAQTKERYREAGVPVVKIEPTWESLTELLVGANGSALLKANDRPYICPTCRERRQQEEKLRRKEEQLQEEERRQEKQCREGARKILKPLERRRKPGEFPKPTTIITMDKFGSYLRSHTKQTLNRHAITIVSMGFQQQASRPTLFRYQSEGWNIHADLDSTDVMRIWEVDCEPAIYAFPPKQTTQCRECILERLQKIMQHHQLRARRYFEDTTGHTKHGY